MVVNMYLASSNHFGKRFLSSPKVRFDRLHIRAFSHWAQLAVMAGSSSVAELDS
jgi:hypothetical protein